MKKRLLLLLVLTGVMIVVSSSVFAVASSYEFTGTSDDLNISYRLFTCVNPETILELQLTNNDFENSIVLNNNRINIQIIYSYDYRSDTPIGSIYPIVSENCFLLNWTRRFSTDSDTNDHICTLNYEVFINDTEFSASETKIFDIRIPDTSFYHYDCLSCVLNIPATTSQIDPFYEAQVTANEIVTKEETIHQTETQWYQNNETAIQAVGLENFNFSSGTTGGLQVMQQQFSNIWNAIGDLNLIYVFTLLMSLATFILRHWPRTRASETITDTVTHTTNLNTGEESAFLTTRKTFRR